MKLTLGRIADILHAEGDFTTNAEATGYSIDSRTLSSGDLFFAVKGDRVDGHDFIETALANGAVAAVVSQGWLPPDEPERVDPCKLLRVPEDSEACEDCVLSALQKLANSVRRTWGRRVVAVTGSAGKTTTKEAIAQVLSARFHVLKSHGNLNNGFGLPLQLLKLEPEHEIAVVELGMNHAGEIAALARIAEPDWAVVSNVAPVHLEHFPEGISGIAAAKYELVQSLPPTGHAFLNADDPWVASFARGIADRVTFYGVAPTSDVRADSITDLGFNGITFQAQAQAQAQADPAQPHKPGEVPEPHPQTKPESHEIHLKLLGRHNVSNALAAIAVAVASGMSLADCATALAHLEPGDRRGELLEYHGAKIVNDCYNSNPRALDAMVDALAATSATRHVVVAGEMLELGPDAQTLHEACGRHMAEQGIDLIVGVRGLAEPLVAAARTANTEAIFFPTTEEAGAYLRTAIRPGDAVLFKASRGVRLERALTLLLDPA